MNKIQNPTEAIAVSLPITEDQLPQWKEVKDKILKLGPSNEEESVPYLSKAIALLEKSNLAKSANEIYSTQKVKDFFLNEYHPSNAKNLLATRTFKRKEVLDMSNLILENLLLYVIQVLPEDNAKIAEMFKLLTDPVKSYYKTNDQDEEGNAPFGVMRLVPVVHGKWLKSLKVGDAVDAIKVHPKYAARSVWSKGQVMSIDEKEIKVGFIDDDPICDKYYPINTLEIAQPGTRTAGDDWREKLKPEEEVDASDTLSVWYQSTILDVRKVTLSLEEGDQLERHINEVLVGYRVFRPDGDKRDADNRAFRGWSSRYDEWLSSSSPRILPAGTIAKRFVNAQASSEDAVLDDSSDLVYENRSEGGEVKYAIIRASVSKSKFLARALNKFGAAGGFDKILERIANKTEWCPIDVVSPYVSAIGAFSGLLFKRFAVDYVPKIREAVMYNILKSPEGHVRNFTKDKIEAVVNGLDAILKRTLGCYDRAEVIEHFTFNIAAICFDSPFLDKKIHGVKAISDLLRQSRQNIAKSISTETILKWVKDKDVINSIFGAKGHNQIMQRSSDLLKHLLSEESLTPADLEVIWQASQGTNYETKLNVYKVFSDISIQLRGPHLDALLDKLLALPRARLSNDEIELVYELIRFSCTIQPSAAERGSRFYWKLILEAEKPDTRELALNKFCDMMKSYDFRESRYKVILECLEKIERNEAILPCIKIITKLIDCYTSASSVSSNVEQVIAPDKFSKSTLIVHLCKEKNLVNVILGNMRAFKERLLKQLKETNVAVTETVLDNLTTGNEKGQGYIVNLTERFNFLFYILGNGAPDIVISYEMLSILWDEFVTKGLLISERDIMFRWFREQAESKTGLPINLSELISFFNEKIVPNATNLTLEGFASFQSVFCILNERLEKLAKVVAPPAQQAASSSHHYWETPKKTQPDKQGDAEYLCKVLPDKLTGIETLWDIPLSASSDLVTEKASNFLTSLHLKHIPELDDRSVLIKNQFLDRCLALLKDAQTEERKLKALKLIEWFVNESERLGAGGLKSHSGLTRGELLSFNVTNSITTGADVQSKIELKMYANATIFELRQQFAKQAKTSWDAVGLYRGSLQKEIKESENGKTLGELRIRNGETLLTQAKPTAPVAESALTTVEKQMSDRMKVIVDEWFDTFSLDQKMSPEHCAQFIHSCTNDNCKAEDQRVQTIFGKWDADKDGALNREEFRNFYTNACVERPGVVWLNLHAHHYRNDLKKASDVEAPTVDVKKLPRYLISRQPGFFNILFALIDDKGKVTTEAWKLLNRLPTSPETYTKILELSGVRGAQTPNWDCLFDPKSSYKLLYELHVLEYLIEEESEGEDAFEEVVNSNPQLKEYKAVWKGDFIFYGGFDQLFKIFQKISAKDKSTFDVFDKNILVFVLKILRNYLNAAFAAKVHNIYYLTLFVKHCHLSLDFVDKTLTARASKAEPEVSAEPAPTTQTQAAAGGTQASASKNPSKKPDEAKGLKIEEPAEFRVLVERLKGELGNHILKLINLDELMQFNLSLIKELLLSKPEFESEDRLIIEHSLSMFLSIVLYEPETMIPKLFSPQSFVGGFDKLILEGIFCVKSVNVSKLFSHAFYLLAREAGKQRDLVASALLNLFILNIPNSKEDDKRKEFCVQFFELLSKLIEITFTDSNAGTGVDVKGLLKKLVESFRGHRSTERRVNPTSDKLLIGLLTLIEKLVSVRKDLRDLATELDLLTEVFGNCLFELRDRTEVKYSDVTVNTNIVEAERDSVKCKSRESRSIAYKLLIKLCTEHPRNMKELLTKALSTLVTKLPQVTTWKYQPAQDTRSYYGYAGIKNLGCICYMNAMIQQFFMTPTFRYAVMMADDRKPPNMVKRTDRDATKAMIDDNTFHQFQRMFGFLELTDRGDYSPTDFCYSFKDFSGNPVNVSVQQDTQEFLNMLFDKLDNSLKPTPWRHILGDVYSGKLCNQMICQGGCGTVRNRLEVFYNMSLGVKNIKTIYESLEKIVKGEDINDYFCETCQKKVDTKKRGCFAELPNVLIVHLQRIVFNLDTFVNEKINTRFEFPHELNLEPYTLEGLEWRERAAGVAKPAAGSEKKEPKPEDDKDQSEDAPKASKDEEKPGEPAEPEGPYKVHPQEYYEYKLAGVVVHSGTADFGHYFSYINANRRNNVLYTDNTDKWYEFNDSSIRDFNPNKIESECFGGSSSDTSDDTWASLRAGRDNSKNAYILVYERKIKKDVRLIVRNEEDRQEISRVFDLSEDKEVKVTKREPAVKTDPDEKPLDEDVTDYVNVNYFKFERYVPERLIGQITEDNQRFMYERHIYSDEFSKFIRDLSKAIKFPAEYDTIDERVTATTPALPPKNTSGADYATIPFVNVTQYQQVKIDEETREIVKSFIQILTKILFELLARAHDNSPIIDITNLTRKYLALCPDAALSFFEKSILDNLKTSSELLLVCPEKQVRSCFSSLLALSINLIIGSKGYKLKATEIAAIQARIANKEENVTVDEKNEVKIYEYLNTLVSILPTEVAKNWTRMQQYLEFWRDFLSSGESQVSYMFEKDMIAVFIDYFLEKKSPLENFSEKKHSMGNRYVNPPFDPLLHSIEALVKRSTLFNGPAPDPPVVGQPPIYNLTDNDYRCLGCPDLFEKVMKEGYDLVALIPVVGVFARENEAFSSRLSVMGLKGVHGAKTADEARPFLKLLQYLLLIEDSLQIRRFEWILGVPCPQAVPVQDYLDSYGVFGSSAIDATTIVMDTPLKNEGAWSLLNQIHVNRRKWEHFTIACLKMLLMTADISENVFNYVIRMPAPSILHAKYTDWIRPYLDQYLVECKRNYFYQMYREDLAQDCYRSFLQMDSRFWAQWTQGKTQEQLQQTMYTYQSFHQPYVIGRTITEEDVTNVQLDQAGEVYLQVTDIHAYVVDSHPAARWNLSFPSELFAESVIRFNFIKPDSPAALFFKGTQQPLPQAERADNAVTRPLDVGFVADDDFELWAIDDQMASYDRVTRERLSGAQSGDANRNKQSGNNPQSSEMDTFKTNTGTDPIDSTAEQRAGATGVPAASNDQTGDSSKKPDSKDAPAPVEQIPEIDYSKMPPIREAIPVRRFQAVNNGKNLVTITLQLRPVGEGPYNFHFITSPMKVTLKPGARFNLMTLLKLNPSVAEWGQYEMSTLYEAQQAPPEAPSKLPTLRQTSSGAGDGNAQIIGPLLPGMQRGSGDYHLLDVEEFFAEGKTCLVCETINPDTALRCSGCETELV